MENNPPSAEQPHDPEQDHVINAEAVLQENQRDPEVVATESNAAEPRPELASFSEQYAQKLEAIEKTRRFLETMPQDSVAYTAMQRALETMMKDINEFVSKFGKPVLPSKDEDS